MQRENDEKNALYVKMFGSFSMRYNGASLMGSKVNETQFAYLMQILLHNRKEGVSRERMEELLFGDRDIKNIHHTMQSVIYNAKNKLRKSGLPEVNYICLKNGTFYWTDEIPVIEDASEFNRLCEEAEEEEDAEKKLQLLLDACHLYTGEFLSSYISVMWAASEARRYRGKFYRCVEEASELLREKQDFMQMEKLGLYATGVAPFSDWEGLTMEALIGMGKYEEASDLYARTVDMYFEERGIRPSERLMNSLDRLGEQIVHPYEQLDSIQNDLNEPIDDIQGGYMCTYPVFKGIYQMILRMLERGGQSVYLMLCTVVDSKGNPMKEGEQLEQLSARLGEAIKISIRQGDAINRYGKGQFLILLMNTTRENCGIIQKRINYNFLVGRQRTGIQYYVNSVICDTD